MYVCVLLVLGESHGEVLVRFWPDTPKTVNLCQVFLLLVWLLVTRCIWLSLKTGNQMKGHAHKDQTMFWALQTLMRLSYIIIHQKGCLVFVEGDFATSPASTAGTGNTWCFGLREVSNLRSWNMLRQTPWFLFQMKWQWEKQNQLTRWAPTEAEQRSRTWQDTYVTCALWHRCPDHLESQIHQKTMWGEKLKVMLRRRVYLG